jgi:Tol biopolymer transport system component
MEASWNPWFPDSSQLAFFTTEGLIVATPDGKRKRVVLRTQEPAGLAVPSPDGRAIAYATFASRPRPAGGENARIWNCGGIWVVGVDEGSHPRRVTGQTPDSTYDLRWLDNEHLVFDRVEMGFGPKAQIWTVAVDR